MGSIINRGFYKIQVCIKYSSSSKVIPDREEQRGWCNSQLSTLKSRAAVQRNCSKLGEWANRNFMKFGKDKSKALHLGKRNCQQQFWGSTGWEAVPLKWYAGVKLHGSQQCALVAEQANSILDSIYRSRSSIGLPNSLLFKFYCLILYILISYHVFVFINIEPIVCYHFCYYPFYKFSLLQLWAYFLSFWGQACLYMKCVASSQHLDWKLGILHVKLLHF